MTVSSDDAWRASNDLRLISDTLRSISRTLHEHTRQLEEAVEWKYANEGGDPRVRLLSEALHVSRVADLELGRLNQAVKRVMTTLPGQANKTSYPAVKTTFEQEREVLTSSITTLKQERSELETLYGIASTLNSTLEFDEVLRLVMDRVIEFVNAERGFLMLVNPQSGALEFTIARNKDAQLVPESAFFNMSRSTVKRVISTREPLLSDDAQEDKELKVQESIMAFGIRSVMCAPLVVRDNCIGAVYVDSRINANLFGPKHRDLLLAFCNQAAIAIDNARLFADLNKAIQKVREDKRYMDNIFGSIANGVVTTDAAGIITTFNKAAGFILMVNPLEAVGKHYQEVFETRPQTGIIELLQDANIHHEQGTIVPHSVDCTIPGRDGPINLNFYVSSLRDNKAYIGMALVVDDRTELRRSQERTREIRRIFERYVHPNVVNQLIKDPNALNLGGETREISVIFADIRGYTRLSESMAPAKVMNLLNSYLEIMVKEIWDEEGTITAFLGDAVMAIFNAPLSQSDHAERAIRAAWKMRMAVMNYQRAQPQGLPISFGFGVNTDEATVGNIGSQGRIQNYTAIGDAVNVASRLQSNASDNNILLNHATYLRVKPLVRVAQMSPLYVKNKSAPLDVWCLLGLQ